MNKKIITTMWTAFAALVVTIGLLAVAVFNGLLGYMPDIQELENPVDKFASQVISADGKQLGTWSYSEANRVFVSYDDLPKHLVDALIATEDERFMEHSGVDIRALFRAIIKRGVLRQKSAGGGSTITQQLAKQLYSEQAHSVMERLFQKPIEWAIAIKLERYYTKEEIITMYLNYFDFLHSAVGIKTAAQTYFQKEPSELTVCEGAMLVGMCKNPSYFNPVRHPERVLQRRNVVLAQMERAGYLNAAETDAYQKETLSLNFRRVDHNEGVGTYLRGYLRQILMAKKPDRKRYASWQSQKFSEDSLAWENDPLYGWCNKNLNSKGHPYNIYTDGLKIYTTIDSRMQAYAEQAVQEHVVGELQPAFDKELKNNPNAPYSRSLSASEAENALKRAIRQSVRYGEMQRAGYSKSEIEKVFRTPIEMTVYSPHGDIDTVMSPLDSLKYYKSFLRTGFMCMENATGAVKAYVGGTDFSHFQYDMCTQGRRQVGSTIKPYLYALAMENGWSPCDVAPNVQKTYRVGNQDWTPRNGSTSRYGEMVTLKWGLATSNNWISAWLMSQLSPAALVRLIHAFGIQNRNITPSMSLCLGPCDISVAEMVSAYTAFSQKGVRRSPMFVSRIEDAEGKVIAEFQPVVNEVISPESSYKMITLMRGVIDGGTGSRMRFRYGINAPMGGKTGTTNDNSDGWFVGYTPELTFGAWVGGEERDVHFASMALGQGANAALPIAAKFLQKVFANPSLGYSQYPNFEIPGNFDPCASELDGEEDVDDATSMGFEEL